MENIPVFYKGVKVGTGELGPEGSAKITLSKDGVDDAIVDQLKNMLRPGSGIKIGYKFVGGQSIDDQELHIELYQQPEDRYVPPITKEEERKMQVDATIEEWIERFKKHRKMAIIVGSVLAALFFLFIIAVIVDS